ncbi:9051_t:CDS:2 [Ambispora gerdemannii]|uniref:9051_t:CDS:1 n=1 Tax=Ambispora gerdemannii TaxID=144530 RepID=A0A9N9A6I2_9GLOM|nr:9051_t:CDS:2 [Ambispora gerdemannii]
MISIQYVLTIFVLLFTLTIASPILQRRQLDSQPVRGPNGVVIGEAYTQGTEDHSSGNGPPAAE